LADLAVLDASALLALMRNEKGAEAVSACLSSSVVSTVNQAEVQTKLVSAGLSEQEAWWHIAQIGCPSVPFDEEMARIAGGLVRLTRPYGLSLGDRACLALALQRNATVYTSDAAWKRLGLDIEVEVIR
jgi:PIN domain nuclease of toxin-antitoxin system